MNKLVIKEKEQWECIDKVLDNTTVIIKDIPFIVIDKPWSKDILVLGSTVACVLSEVAVTAKGKSIIVARDQATIIAKEMSKVYAFDRSHVITTNKAIVFAYDETEITANQNSTVYCRCESETHLHDKSLAFVADYASVNGYDDSLIFDFGTTGFIEHETEKQIRKPSIMRWVRYIKTRNAEDEHVQKLKRKIDKTLA